MWITSVDEFIVCAKTDRLFGLVLGRTLERAVARLVALGAVSCLAFLLVAAALT